MGLCSRRDGCLNRGAHLLEGRALWLAGEATIRREPTFFVERIGA